MRRPLPGVVFLLPPLIVGAIVLFFATRYSYSSKTQNVTMGDLPLLVTAPELLEAIGRDDVKVDEHTEAILKERLPRGGRQLTYSCHSVTPLVDIDSRVVVELDELTARATFAAWLPVPPSKLTAEARESPVSWGDEVKYYELREGERLVGHSLLARKGTRVVLYRFTGVAFSEPQRLAAHLLPRLRAVETFAP